MTEPERRAGDPEIVLRLLLSTERDSTITQRKLAGNFGIALGLANTYLRQGVCKGFVEATRVPFNRYACYVPPLGFAENTRVTAEFVAVSANFFHRGRANCAELLVCCEAAEWGGAVPHGAGELAEIAVWSGDESAVIDSVEARWRCLAVAADGSAERECANPNPLDRLIWTDTPAFRSRLCEAIASAALYCYCPSDIVAPMLLGIPVRPIKASAVV